MSDILIIEDHDSVRTILREILEDERHTVRDAADGETALVLARERRPDIVFLDLQMPGMDGREVLQKLRSDPATEETRVVVVTAMGDEEREDLLELGADDYFTKPFSPLALLELVERLHDER